MLISELRYVRICTGERDDVKPLSTLGTARRAMSTVTVRISSTADTPELHVHQHITVAYWRASTLRRRERKKDRLTSTINPCHSSSTRLMNLPHGTLLTASSIQSPYSCDQLDLSTDREKSCLERTEMRVGRKKEKRPEDPNEPRTRFR
jgi:hypothetical protein